MLLDYFEKIVELLSTFEATIEQVLILKYSFYVISGHAEEELAMLDKIRVKLSQIAIEVFSCDDRSRTRKQKTYTFLEITL